MKITIDYQYSRSSEKFFRLHEDVRSQFISSIVKLVEGDHPEQVDHKRMKGKYKNYFRIRIGDYRVIYTLIRGEVVVVDVIMAGSRGDVYKKM